MSMGRQVLGKAEGLIPEGVYNVRSCLRTY